MSDVSNSVCVCLSLTDYRFLLLCVFVAILAIQVHAVSTSHPPSTAFYFICCILIKNRKTRKKAAEAETESAFSLSLLSKSLQHMDPVGVSAGSSSRRSLPSLTGPGKIRLGSVKWGSVL